MRLAAVETLLGKPGGVHADQRTYLVAAPAGENIADDRGAFNMSEFEEVLQ